MLLQLAGVVWSATCGTITPAGLYTAPASGTCRVIATAAPRADTALVTVAQSGTTGTGLPFGPFQLWSGATLQWGPASFTGSQNFSDPATVVQQIANARTAKQRLVLVLTGGGPSEYSTGGHFDHAKWTARLQQYNTAAIKTAIAQGVADGTVIANSIMDEPEHLNWGLRPDGTRWMRKAILDSMAAESHALFPTLPVGPSHGPNGYYLWYPADRYRVVDYTLNQYNYWVTNGDAAKWRDLVLAQARLDGVGVLFSMNILDGGQNAPDKATWVCPTATSAGHGTYAPACRMTATQIRDWGKALGPSGCGLMLWQMDAAAVGDAGNRTAFADVATTLNAAPRTACRRP